MPEKEIEANSSMEKDAEKIIVSSSVVEIDEEKEIHDKAYALLRDHIQEEVTPEENAAVLKKLNWRIMPLLFMMYGLEYIDKAALSWGVMFNLEEDTNITSSQYSWVASAFYFGYLAAEYPANVIVHKFSVVKILFCVCMAWGILMLAHVGCTSFAGLMVSRFLLGVSEAPVTSCMTIYVGNWFTKKEQPIRFLCFNSGQGGCYILYSFIVYGIGHAGGPLNPWRYIYILMSLSSLLVGAFIYFLPTLPSDAKFLTDHEKTVAAKRVADNMMGIKSTEWKWYQVGHALKDIKTYLLIGCMCFVSIPNGGITNFNTMVVSSFDFDHYQTILVGLPSSVFSAGQMWLWALADRHFKSTRVAGMILPMLIAIVGISIVYGTEDSGANKWGRVFAYWMINSYSVQFPYMLNMMGQNIAGHTKRSFTNACVLVMFGAANIIGPFCFKSSDAPNYSHALATIMGCFAAEIACGAALGLVIWRENSSRDKKYGKPAQVEDLRLQGIIDGLKDKTDLENKNFRYVY